MTPENEREYIKWDVVKALQRGKDAPKKYIYVIILKKTHSIC